MNYDDYSHPIRRSPRAAHELRQVFEQLQLENNAQDYNLDKGEDNDDSSVDHAIPPLQPRKRLDLYEDLPATSPAPSEPPPRSPAHVNPLRSHPVAANGSRGDAKSAPAAPLPTSPGSTQDSRPVLRYRFSHPFREQLYAPRQPDPAPRRRPANLVSYKPAHQRLHPRLRKRTSLDTIASVTTTASVPEPEDAEFADDDADDETPYLETSKVETSLPSMFTLDSEYPITPNVDLGPPPSEEPPTPGSLPESLRTASVDSISTMPPTTPVSSAETHPPRGILRKLKPGKRKDSIGAEATGKIIIERTVSVDQTSYRSNSSSASNTVSSGTPSRYPPSEAGNSRSSSTWTASSHDISSLTPEELKKCKKKGINPALFAEMKAARKGKWTSPIGGNTFLA